MSDEKTLHAQAGPYALYALLSYQANPTTKVVSYTHPVTGEEYQRLSNTNRAKTYAVLAIRFLEHESKFCVLAGLVCLF